MTTAGRQSRFRPVGRWPVVAALAFAGGLWTCPPLPADWLVTRDGGKVETKGPWKLDGKRVVFTAADGTLASLRLVEVDLEASREATAAALEAADEAAPPPPKKSVRVLTDKDFSHPEPSSGAAASSDAAEGAAAGEGESAGTSQPPANPVQVASWKQNYNQATRTMEISGSVRNAGTEMAAAVSVMVRLFDDREQLIAERDAALNTRSLQAGQNTAFSVTFPGVMFFGSVKFDVKSFPLRLSPGAEPPPESQPEPPQPAAETPPPF